MSVQVIDKSLGGYNVLKTIASSSYPREVNELVKEGKRFLQAHTGVQEPDFTDYQNVYLQVLSSISSHKLVGIK